MTEIDRLNEENDDYKYLIESYEALKISDPINEDDYIFLIDSYKEIINDNVKKIEQLKPSSASKTVQPSPIIQKTTEELKLEKIKNLLKANEQIINECGFKIEP